MNMQTGSRLLAASVALLIGIVLLWATISKLRDPSSIQGVIMYLTGSWRVDADTLDVLVGVLVGVEATLGLLVIGAPRSRLVVAIFSGILALFTIVLVILAIDPRAPKCGCFGSSLAITRHETLFGVSRNLAMIFGLAWASSRLRTHGPSPATSKRRLEPTTRGFTLIESLAVIVIIGVLLSLSFPSLAKARASARNASSKLMMRQLTAGLIMYAQNFRECFPYAGVRGDYWAARTFRGVRLDGGSDYFSDQSKFWPSIVVPEYAEVPASKIELSGVRERLAEDGRPEWMILTRFYLTFTAFSAPESWTDDSPRSSSVFRPVAWHEMLFPSRKGVLIDIGAGWWNPDDPNRDSILASFGDGSARAWPVVNHDPQLECYPPFAPFSGNFFTTRRGIAGLDSP
jgi:prepilin-type N-terminal cleavage/methylation domain-containing protein